MQAAGPLEVLASGSLQKKPISTTPHSLTARQIASTFADAFTELLGVYQSLGEELPLVLQYEKVFSEDDNMKRVLGYLYKDVLEFHRRALKYFQQPSKLIPPARPLTPSPALPSFPVLP